MPIILVGGGVVAVLTSLAKLVYPSVPTIVSPPVGLGLGAVYLLLGGAYEWVIQKQIELDEWYERQQKLLDELEAQEEQ